MTVSTISLAVDCGVFPGPGKTARRLRTQDWNRTVLGPPETWPQHLRALVPVCLVSDLPMVIWWGASRAMLYNDPFVPLLGGRPASHLPGTPGPPKGTAWWQTVRPRLEQVCSTGEAGTCEEVSLDFANGSSDFEHAVRFHLTPILGPDGRQVDGVLGIVAESAPAAAAAQHARLGEKLRRAMEIETVGIIFFNTTGAITDANDAFLRMSGYTRADLRRGEVRWDRMTPSEWMPRSLQAVDEFKALGRTIPYEKQYLRKDGSRWWALFSATRLDDDEGVEFIIDITERKAADEELRRHRDDLEVLVQDRTAALDAANGALRDEIVERRRVEAARQELQRQLASAQEDERRRISRELHDEVGQHLTALMLGLKSLQVTGGLRLPYPTIASLQAITEKVGKQIHDLALELRPTALDDLGLLRTLSNYIEQWAVTSNIEVDFHSSGWTGERLPAPIETTAYRIVQEALTNILKHARASRVSLIIERRPDQVKIIIEDNGAGFDVEAVSRHRQGKRLGLLGMEERAALMDGEVKVESNIGEGTTVFVRIPLPLSKTGKAHG